MLLLLVFFDCQDPILERSIRLLYESSYDWVSVLMIFKCCRTDPLCIVQKASVSGSNEPSHPQNCRLRNMLKGRELSKHFLFDGHG